MEENIHNNDQQLNNTSANTAVMVDSLVDLIAAQELLRKEKEEAAEKARLQAIAEKEAAEKARLQAIAEKEAREKAAKAKADAIALATKADQEATTSEVLPEVIQTSSENAEDIVETEAIDSENLAAENKNDHDTSQPSPVDGDDHGTQIPEQNVSKKGKGFLWIIIGILILAAIGAGYYVLNQNQNATSAETTVTETEAFKITYTIGAEQEVLTEATYGAWLKTDADGNVTVDETKLTAYLNGLNDRYTTIGKDHSFVNHAGEAIVVSGGTYGWAMDVETEAVQLKQDLLTGKNVTREPASNGVVYTESGDDIGTTYVEISIADQTMWLYVDGNCVVETPVVTGDQTIKTQQTPVGVYSILSHDVNRTLAGTNADGSTYTCDVKYWMLLDGDIGISDADGWRKSYGGEIYLTDGSHGSINTPEAACKEIFEKTTNGCPVVIY